MKNSLSQTDAQSVTQDASATQAAKQYPSLPPPPDHSLDIFWLKDKSLEDSDNLPAPDIIAQEVVDDPEAAQEQFRLIAADLGEKETAA